MGERCKRRWISRTDSTVIEQCTREQGHGITADGNSEGLTHKFASGEMRNACGLHSLLGGYCIAGEEPDGSEHEGPHRFANGSTMDRDEEMSLEEFVEATKKAPVVDGVQFIQRGPRIH
jgi:hypothetical protein